MLSAGSIVTGELLRMTAPRAPMVPAAAAPAAAVAAVAAAAAMQNAESARTANPEVGAPPIGDFERVASDLKALGDAARKITVMGVVNPAGTSPTALTLARLLGRNSSVVLVDMSMSPTLRAVMADATVPGLSDLAMGTASFGQVIGKDRMSGVQIISSGTQKMDAATLHSPRLMMTIDALMRVYDHVVLDAGSLDEIPEHLVATNAHAVLIATGLDGQTRDVVRNELFGAGFRGVTMLDHPVDPSQLGRPGGRMAAA
jgi:polysaccharide biosynthesis transport protein